MREPPSPLAGEKPFGTLVKLECRNEVRPPDELGFIDSAALML